MPDTHDPTISGEEVEELRRRLAEAEGRAQGLERRLMLDAALVEAAPADADAARTLAEAALAAMPTPDPVAAVAELRRSKPYLFRTQTSLAAAMSPSVETLPGGQAPAEHAAAQARVTGNRRDLLAYLRLRRSRGC